MLVIGTLLVHNLTVHGSIHGPGTLGFAYFTDQPPQMTATDIAVQQGTLVLFCFVLFCFVLFCFVLYCLVMSCLVLSCLVLLCFVLFCSILY